MTKSTRVYLILVLSLALLASLPTGVYAHRMIIDAEGDLLSVRYDDNTAASRSTVRLYNENDEVIWEGSVDSDGRVRVPISRYAKAVAEDGLGHQRTYIPGQVQRELPRPLAAALGVSLLLFVASFSHYLSQKKEQKKQSPKE